MLAGGFGAEEEEAGGGAVGLEGVGEEGFGEGLGYGLWGEEVGGRSVASRARAVAAPMAAMRRLGGRVRGGKGSRVWAGLGVSGSFGCGLCPSLRMTEFFAGAWLGTPGSESGPAVLGCWRIWGR